MQSCAVATSLYWPVAGAVLLMITLVLALLRHTAQCARACARCWLSRRHSHGTRLSLSLCRRWDSAVHELELEVSRADSLLDRSINQIFQIVQVKAAAAAGGGC